MLHTLELKLTSPFLGNQKSPATPVRIFRRKPDGTIILEMSQWEWALQSATTACKINCALECVRPGSGWITPRSSVFRRDWKKGGASLSEDFECIPEDANIKLNVFLAQMSEKRVAGPTTLQFAEMLGFVGEYLGLSPWGAKMGYGRFTVTSMAETTYHR